MKKLYKDPQGKFREVVIDYMVKMNHLVLVRTAEDMDHIVNIGASILMTKYKIGPSGGSFVSAIVNNDLQGAFAYADEVNQRNVRFYVNLVCNVQCPELEVDWESSGYLSRMNGDILTEYLTDQQLAEWKKGWDAAKEETLHT